MPAHPLTEAIEGSVPLVVLSPHLDDAALSCGALMIRACGRTPVTVATFFTQAGLPPYTLSARRYLRQVGAADAQELYRQRRAEDRAALEPLGIRCVHAGLTEAQFRLRPGRRSPWARLLPELGHLYPVYRLHTISGRIAPADAGTLREVCDVIERLAGGGRSLVLAPLGVGGHVDHVLVRTAAERIGTRAMYYSDFPYNQRHPPDNALLRQAGLAEARWSRQLEAKAELVRAYRTQVHALFPGGHIPLVPEAFYFRQPTATARTGAAGEGNRH